MIDFLQHNWEYIIGIFTSGGLSSVLTMKIGVKSAKTDLSSKVQDVYGKMVFDLQKEVDRIKELGCLDKDCDKRKKL